MQEVVSAIDFASVYYAHDATTWGVSYHHRVHRTSTCRPTDELELTATGSLGGCLLPYLWVGLKNGVKRGVSSVKASLQTYFHVDRPTLKAADYFDAEDVGFARDAGEQDKLPVFQVLRWHDCGACGLNPVSEPIESGCR